MKTEVLKFENLDYVIRFPNGYKSDEKYPVIIYLHGVGTRGNDVEVLKNTPFLRLINNHSEFPFVVVAPQCSVHTWFDMFEQLKRFVMTMINKDFADKDRIYLTGASMGGYGSWQLAMSMPEVFAAVAPVCGGGMYWDAQRLADVPVWAFHGGKDTVVRPEESVKMVEAVNGFGGRAKLTVYPENGHDAWTDAYGTYDLFEWMLGCVNGRRENMDDGFGDSEMYG